MTVRLPPSPQLLRPPHPDLLLPVRLLRPPCERVSARQVVLIPREERAALLPPAAVAPAGQPAGPGLQVQPAGGPGQGRVRGAARDIPGALFFRPSKKLWTNTEKICYMNSESR